jgi:transposase
VVWSVDEKTGMQATSRINPTRPAVPGIPVRREFEYRRHGTAVLFAALNVHDGDVAGWVTDSTRSENFVAFLADLVAQIPAGLGLHCIVDNLKTHSTDLVDTFLAQHSHVHLHFTPTHASWLNQVELFFSILQRRLLRRGEFDSVDDLADRIITFIKDYNRRARPFRWTCPDVPIGSLAGTFGPVAEWRSPLPSGQSALVPVVAATATTGHPGADVLGRPYCNFRGRRSHHACAPRRVRR